MTASLAPSDTAPVSSFALRHPLKYIVAVLFFGNVAIAYDFTSYLFIADVVNPLFFPIDLHIVTPYLETASVIATGFLARPLGAWWIGRYGDSKGRKPAYTLSLQGLILLTFIGIFLPTYEQAGILGTILFISARLFQGMLFGGHVVLSWTYIAETAPRARFSFLFSLVTVGIFTGVVISSSVFQIIQAMLSFEQLITYGWRLQFIIGLLLTVGAFVVRHQLTETPLFSLTQLSHNQTKPPLQNVSLTKTESAPCPAPIDFKLSALFNGSSALMITILLSLIATSLFVSIVILLPKLLPITHYVDDTRLTIAHNFGLIGLIFGSICYGWLADRVDIGRLLMSSGVFFVFQVILFYAVLDIVGNRFIAPLYFALGLASGAIVLCLIISVQLFPTRKRLTLFGITFNTMAVLTGVVLSIGLTYISEFFTLAPAIYLVVLGLVTVLVGMSLNSLNPE